MLGNYSNILFARNVTQKYSTEKNTVNDNFYTIRNITILTVFLLAGIIYSSSSFASDADERYIYIGSEFGVSDPVIKKFSHKTDEGHNRLSLKRSVMYGGRIGYSFYPDMMIELSITHQPRFNMGYILPENTPIAKTHGTTKVTGNVFTLNLIYEIPQQVVGMKPYVIFGAGLAQVLIKPSASKTDNLVPLGFPENFTFFKVRKYKNNCFVWQAGVGVVKNLGNNISIDVGAKLQVVNNIKFKYDVLNKATGNVDPAQPIKKTIGTGEFTIGLTYKIPV